MPDEGELGEQDAERRGHQQLEPGVVEQDDAGDDAAESESETDQEHAVEPPGPRQQSLVADSLSQSGVGLRHRVGFAYPRGGCQDGHRAVRSVRAPGDRSTSQPLDEAAHRSDPTSCP